MSKVILKGDIKIENMIYEVRGKEVMLDSDLARLYECVNGTKTINQAVKRHINRFPERFMFKLTKNEFKNLLSQIGTTNYNMSRSLPFVFTEQGVVMLATVLRTSVAEEVSIAIMDAFVMMRKYMSNNLLEQRYFNNQVIKNTEDIKLLQESFSKFEEKKKINEIYFNGQIYDAYSKIKDIISSAKKELVIIDAYADKMILDIIRDINVNAILIVKSNSLLTKLDIEKYNSQYNNLKIIYNNTFHDRYFILDKEVVYHCGTSVNHAGSKTFSINLLEENLIIKALIDRIDTLS